MEVTCTQHLAILLGPNHMLLPIYLEVFTNCHKLCVKVQESQVEQVFYLITKSEPPEQAALLQALKSMTVIRVSDSYIICWY